MPLGFQIPVLVPSEVPMLHQLNRAPDSITLSWPQPDRPNGDILEYQLRYYDKGSDENSAMSVFSETNTVTVAPLTPGSIYAFQIRARNERGFGPYSHTIYFSTLAMEEQSRRIQNRLPLLVGSVMGGAAFLLVVAAIVIVFVFRRRPLLSLAGVKYYVDPSTYEDPSEAVKEFAREIDPAHLKIEEVIGAAQFGEVSRGRYRPLGRKEVLVAVKTLRWGVTERERGVFLSEAGVLGQFDHPNVLKLEGVITHSPPERIITEFMENGPLDAFLRENEDQFSVLQLVGMVRGVGAGMRYLSERNFVHRDLAARNVLVNSNLVCKVSDFGLSRLMKGLDHNMPTYTASLGSKIPVRWTAPEAFQHRKFSSASDVWSFGILMWEVMSYGERPYWDMSNQEELVSAGPSARCGWAFSSLWLGLELVAGPGARCGWAWSSLWLGLELVVAGPGARCGWAWSSWLGLELVVAGPGARCGWAWSSFQLDLELVSAPILHALNSQQWTRLTWKLMKQNSCSGAAVPQSDRKTVMKAVVDQYRLPAPNGCPSALHALMLQCWQADRQDRPGFDSLLSSLDRLIRHPASLKAEHARSVVLTRLRLLSLVEHLGDHKEPQRDTTGVSSGLRDVQALGVNLLGHQRKIVNAAQQLRTHLTQGQDHRLRGNLSTRFWSITVKMCEQGSVEATGGPPRQTPQSMSSWI
ncbi:hypothetical protein NFI96_006734 [Prochilodus magdalenae]|nr:hypothetical protein NFI96_006734 [Prochilodus magdalenae]